YVELRREPADGPGGIAFGAVVAPPDVNDVLRSGAITDGRVAGRLAAVRVDRGIDADDRRTVGQRCRHRGFPVGQVVAGKLGRTRTAAGEARRSERGGHA